MSVSESTIRERLAAAVSQRGDCVAAIEKLQAKMAALDAQQSLLEELLSLAVKQPRLENAEEAWEPAAVRATSNPDGLRPVDGVMTLLSENPQGMQMRRIIEELLPKIATASGNPQAIVRNTLHNLLKRGKLSKDEETGVYRLIG